MDQRYCECQMCVFESVATKKYHIAACITKQSPLPHQRVVLNDFKRTHHINQRTHQNQWETLNFYQN